MDTVQATHLYCEKSGGPEGGDNTTHHLVPTASGDMVCRYCKQSQKKIEGR